MDNKEFACRDFGMDCDWRTSGSSDEEIFKNASDHGREKHGLTEFTHDMREKVRQKIRDVKAA